MRDSMTYVHSRSFTTEELSELLFAMVLIGMDPNTSEGLRTDIRKACDSLEKAMGLAQQVELDAFLAQLAPDDANVSFFPLLPYFNI